jgi:hypothetical protein
MPPKQAAVDPILRFKTRLDQQTRKPLIYFKTLLLLPSVLKQLVKHFHPIHNVFTYAP